MVKQEKLDAMKEIVENCKKYSVIGIIDMFKLPSKQLQSIRKDLRNQVIIKMYKKKIIQKAFQNLNIENLMKLYDYDPKKPALVFSNTNPFKLYKLFDKSKTPTFAKEGDIAPYDIIIKEGPTKLPAGPAIGELQRAKIPAMVKEGKIHVSKDTVVAKQGTVITAELASLLKKLEIQPMEMGANVLAAWEGGIVFDSSVLAVNEQEYINNLQKAYQNALNLAVGIAYPTKESVKLLIQKAFINAKSLGVEAEILDSGIIEDLLEKGERAAKVLKSKVNV
ncbi:MAG: 50S ribosomal protein L10 [Candidatus Aenigmatarchaeota archaeon]|nr:50S ribosomal protein L10 [Candidatus Aenigmarchaeota archaeon]